MNSIVTNKNYLVSLRHIDLESFGYIPKSIRSTSVFVFEETLTLASIVANNTPPLTVNEGSLSLKSLQAFVVIFVDDSNSN